MRKPRIFIASSVESLPIAEAAHVNLDHEFEVSLWRTSTFKLSSSTIDDLATKASSVDSDLLGVNFADFDPTRTDKDMESATSAACIAIRKRSSELGVISQTTLPKSVRLKSNPPRYQLAETDYEFLSACLESHTSFPHGLEFHFITNNLRSLPNKMLRISAVKLERLNLIEKSVQADDRDGYDYFSYSITEQGIDELLEHSDKLSVKPEVQLEDDIPF